MLLTRRVRVRDVDMLCKDRLPLVFKILFVFRITGVKNTERGAGGDQRTYPTRRFHTGVQHRQGKEKLVRTSV